MKRFMIAALLVAFCGSVFAGGEIPAPSKTLKPLPNCYQVQVPQPVGFWTRAGNYGKNVWYGTTDFVGTGVSTAVYTVTLGGVDLCKRAEFQPTFWN
jgi:hypothetical protein